MTQFAKIAFPFFIGFSMLMGCQTVKDIAPIVDMQDIILEADSISLYRVEGFPTPKDQLMGRFSINDYLVLREVPLSNRQKKDLQVAVLDDSNYDLLHTKQCPFVANYAIQYKKDDRIVAIVLNVGTCSKSLFFDTPLAEQGDALELVQENSIAAIIEEIDPIGVVQ